MSGAEASFADRARRLAGMAGVVLGWTPDTFWKATPAELTALIEALTPEGAAGPDRDTIRQLMEAFPDG